jgi:hypothetical protein
MNKSTKRNFGPCIVCGNQEPNKTYRKINAQNILKISQSPNIENINFQVDDQLCQKHHNELINYDRNNNPKIGQKQKSNKDKSYHQGGTYPKRVCLTQEKYENLIEKIDELQEHTNKLEIELEQALSYIIIYY